MEISDSSLFQRIIRINEKIDEYEPGTTLQVTVNDIAWLVGAATQLYKNVENLKKSYQSEMNALKKQIDEKDSEYTTARKTMLRLDQKITKYEQIIKQVKMRPRWLLGQGLRAELDNLIQREEEGKL